MQSVKTLIVQITLIAFLCTGFSVPSFGAVMTTQNYLSQSASLSQSAHAGHLDSIDSALKREDVRQLLIARGVSPDDAMTRIAALPEGDLAILAEQMDELPAGGDLLALVGAVFIVLLILELTGVINIFNKV